MKAALAAGQPAISVDTKKKELVGDFKNGGRELRRKGEPEPIRVHDFEIKGLGKVAPLRPRSLALSARYQNLQSRIGRYQHRAPLLPRRVELYNQTKQETSLKRLLRVRPLRAMGIRDKPIALGSPWQNCFAERLIGTIRRECVDHVIAWDEQHLHQVLKSYANYYDTSRTHRSLDKDAPVSRPVQRIGRIASHAMAGGLHHRYVRI